MTHYNSFDITSVLTVSKHTESTRGLRDVMDAFGGKFSQRHLICMDVHLLAKNLSLQLEPNTDCCLIIIIISLLSLEVQLFLVFQSSTRIAQYRSRTSTSVGMAGREGRVR